MKDPRVLNIRDLPVSARNWPTDCEYIGRSTAWGNPWVVGVHGKRREVLEKFDVYLRGHPDPEGWLGKLVGKRLVCHCSPKYCHGHLIVKYIDELGLSKTTLF